MKKALISLYEIDNMCNGLKLDLLSSNLSAETILKVCATFEAVNAVYKKWFNMQPEAPQWVEVEGGSVPPRYKQVFIRCEMDGEARGVLDNDGMWFHIFRGVHYPCKHVTHWMPILPVPGVDA